jgi:ABC-2 type transport system ATP-binding protein
VETLNAMVQTDSQADTRLVDPESRTRRREPVKPVAKWSRGSRSATRLPRVTLECRGLWLRDGEQVLAAGIDLRIRPGTSYRVVDPQGASKTALARMICGLVRPDEGKVMVQGKTLGTLTVSTERELVAYVAHDVVVLPSATLGDNLRFWARHTGLTGFARQERIQRVLAVTGLTGFTGLSVEQCTGGVLRLLSLAVSLLHRPKLLVLDDAGHGIDEHSRVQLSLVLSRLCQSGASVFYSCRDINEGLRLPGHTGLIHQGRLVPAGRGRKR